MRIWGTEVQEERPRKQVDARDGGRAKGRFRGRPPTTGLCWRDLAVFAFYALVTLGMTYPLATRLSTHTAGDGSDMWIAHWNNWWIREALWEGRSVLSTSFLFHPQGTGLTWHGFSWLNTALWLPLQALVGSLAAHGVSVLLAYALGACTAYLLAGEVTGSRLAALVAGLVFAFYPAHHAHRNQLKLLSVQWLPLCALWLMRVTRRHRLRDGLWMGVSFAVCALTATQLLLLGGLWAALWLAYSLVAERPGWSWRTVGAIGLAVLVCVLIAGPALAPLVRGLLDPETAQDIGTGDTYEKRTDLLGFFVPSKYHPLTRTTYVQTLVERWSRIPGRSATVGYGTLALALWAALKRWRRARFWALAALLLAVLALGSALQVNGREFLGIPLPYRLLAFTPFGTALRNPYRLNLLLAVPVTVLVAIGICDLLGRLPALPAARGTLVAGTAALVLFEYLVIPFPTTRPVDSDFYSRLRDEPGEFAVADVPIGFHRHDKWYMYAQTLHGRPIVGGHVSRVPVHAHDFIDGVALLRAAKDGAPERGTLNRVSRRLEPLAEAGVRYVMVHKDRARAEDVERWREWFGFQPTYEDEVLLVYRTEPEYDRDFGFVAEPGDGIGVVGATLSSALVAGREALRVEVVWGTQRPPERDWAGRLALRTGEGEEVWTEEFELSPGWPTSEWGGDEVVRSWVEAGPLPPGAGYEVVVGLVGEPGDIPGEWVPIGEVDVAGEGSAGGM